jgi:hypothetical protein
MTQQINIIDKTNLITLAESKNSIKQTNNVLEILGLIKQVADKNTIVVFDVDNVLMMQGGLVYRSSILFEVLKEKYGSCESHPIKQFWCDQIINIADLLSCHKEKSTPVDDKMHDVINYLLENKIKSLALTHASYLAIHEGKPYDQVRYNDLKSLGIDFIALSGLNNSEIISLENSEKIKLHNGIIFARNQQEKQLNKGFCLNAVLEKLSYKPSKIVFIDDMAENHHHVMNACADKGIEFYGLHYTKAYEIDDMKYCFDLVNIQLNRLLERGEWLTDSEARLIMEDCKIFDDGA